MLVFDGVFRPEASIFGIPDSGIRDLVFNGGFRPGDIGGATCTYTTPPIYESSLPNTHPTSRRMLTLEVTTLEEG